MIVSHKNKFIFIHCRKVAGSSMKVELAKHLGDKDIVIGSLHEIMQNGVRLPRATLLSIMTARGLISFPFRILKGASIYQAFNASAKFKFYSTLSKDPVHPPADLVQKAFPKEWASYFKFAFVRNPYERLVSDYFWRKASSGLEFSFLDYLRTLSEGNEKIGIIHRGAVSILDMITIDGKIEVDFLGRFEYLRKDFQKLGERFGISLSLGVHEKSGETENNYGFFYGENEKRLANLLVRDECLMLGYEYPYNFIK